MTRIVSANSVSFASQTPRQRRVARRGGLPEQHKSRSGRVSKSIRMERQQARYKRNTHSYVALQELPARRVITSMVESSENDVVITVEKNWFICFRESKYSVSGLSTRLSSGLPRCSF